MIFYDEEWRIIFQALLLGLRLSFLYDFLRGVRRAGGGAWWRDFLCDTLFWCCAVVWSFRLMHRYSNGLLRWYALGAIFVAVWIYTKSVGRLFRKLWKSLADPARKGLTKLKSLAIIKTHPERKEADDDETGEQGQDKIP